MKVSRDMIILRRYVGKTLKLTNSIHYSVYVTPIQSAANAIGSVWRVVYRYYKSPSYIYSRLIDKEGRCSTIHY